MKTILNSKDENDQHVLEFWNGYMNESLDKLINYVQKIVLFFGFTLVFIGCYFAFHWIFVFPGLITGIFAAHYDNLYVDLIRVMKDNRR